MGQTAGARLRRSRDRLALTQDELATRSGVPATTISRIERDRLKGRPAQRTMRRLAEALGVDPGWLLIGEERAA